MERTKTRPDRRPSYDAYLKAVTDSCNQTLRRRSARPGRRKEVHWWCAAVSKKRKECLRNRRAMTRANGGTNEERKAETARLYKISRADYNREILQSKKRSWQAMLDDLNRDEWGQGYKIIVKRAHLKGANRLSEERQQEEARKLFPTVDDPVG